MARMLNIPLGECPTCAAGIFSFRGREIECDCELQMLLRKHYLLANIGDQYMRLNWEDYKRSNEVKEHVTGYLDSWESAKRNGTGIEFRGPLGVGKTMAATHVGKELIKRGERVFFLPFLEVIALYTREDETRQELECRLKESTVLILDEIVPPFYEGQKHLFASEFERLIRHRTNFNLTTVTTTNLSGQKLDEHYPKSYSLLAAKQIPIEMGGEDFRRSVIALENLEIAAANEVRPIT